MSKSYSKYKKRKLQLQIFTTFCIYALWWTKIRSREDISYNFKNSIGFFLLIYLGVMIVHSLFLWFKKRHRRKKYLASDIQEIDQMSGSEFELVCANHFRKLGYRVEETPASCDMGADLILRKGHEVIAVQCKRYKNKLSNSCVQEVVASMPIYNATSCMVVTNSFFTPNCRAVAEANGCILWDRNTIIENFKIRE